MSKTRSFSLILSLIILTGAFAVINLVPAILKWEEFKVDDNENERTMLLIKYLIISAIIILIPSLLHIFADSYYKNCYSVAGKYSMIIIIVVIIIPNILFLLFIKNVVLLSILINIQMMVAVVATFIFLSSLDNNKSRGSSGDHSIILLVLLFNVSLTLLNYSLILAAVEQLIIRLFEMLLLILCIFIIKSNSRNHITFRKLYNNFVQSEMIVNDQEIFFCLFSLVSCTGGYVIYTFLLVFGIHYGRALFFLILVQIISVMPVVYLESRIAKRLVFQLQVK